MSDPHDDHSHAVDPCRTDPLNSDQPSPVPSSVAMIPPVEAAFARVIVQPKFESVECPCVMLPKPPPEVTCVRLLPIALCPTLHRTDVSDSHAVCSQPVFPSLALTDDAVIPRLAP